MAGLKQFRNIPRDLMEWSRWMRDQDVEAGLGDPTSNDRVLTSDADGTRSWQRRYDQWPGQWRGSANQALSTSAITVDLAVEDINPDAHYALDSDAVFVENPGYYRIQYTLFASVDSTAGSADCNVLAFLRKDGAVIDGSYSAAYLSEVSTPDTSCDGQVIVLLSAGNGIDLRGQLSAAMDVSTVAARCKLTMERIR